MYMKCLPSIVQPISTDYHVTTIRQIPGWSIYGHCPRGYEAAASVKATGNKRPPIQSTHKGKNNDETRSITSIAVPQVVERDVCCRINDCVDVTSRVKLCQVANGYVVAGTMEGFGEVP